MPERISSFQLTSLLVLTRIFSDATHFPSDVAVYDMQEFTVVILTFLLMCLCAVPCMVFNHVAAGQNLRESYFSYVAKRNKPLGWVMFALFGAVLLFIAVVNTAKLEFYVESTIMDGATPLVLILLIMAAALFGLLKGLQGIARMGPLLIVVYVFTMLAVIISLVPSMNPAFLYPNLLEHPRDLMSGILEEMVKNNEIFIFVLLVPCITDKANRTAYIMIPAVFVMKMVITALVMMVFGPMLNDISFPLHALAAQSGIVLFERLDGLDITVWTASSVVKTSLLLICFHHMLRCLIDHKLSIKITMAAGAVCGVITYVSAINHHVVLTAATPAVLLPPMALLTIILPIIVVIVIKRGARKRISTPGETGEVIS